MRARGRKFGVKTRPQIFLAQYFIFFNGSTAFRFPRNSRKSSSTAFRFLQRLSDFRPQIFLCSKFDFLQRLSDFREIRENLLQWLSDFFDAFRFLQRISTFRNGFLIFLNGFPISSMAFQFSSTAFHFPRNPGKSIYGGKYTKDRYPSFVFSA